MFDQELVEEVSQIAASHDIEPAALMAVIEVESRGEITANVNGREEPLIRFEGHYFYKLLPRGKRNQAVVDGLAASSVGKIRNPIRQAGRWKLLERACKLDRIAALSSCSWGCGQVMGAHWRWLGFGSVDALVAEARDGASGQVRLMMRFIEKSGLVAVLQAHDWPGFARRYNGPLYYKYKYDTKLRSAYRRYASKFSRTEAASVKPMRNEILLLRVGSRGPLVKELQSRLRSIGYHLAVDGDFGPATERNVTLFQKSSRLKVDGLVGPKTNEMLLRKLPVVA